MSNCISIYQLPINLHLFSAQEKELKSEIGRLSLTDLKEDAQFERTTRRIKDTFLLKLVVFQGDPKITKNRQTEKVVQPNAEDMWGGTRLINIVTVEFYFEGSCELFEYSPNNITIGGHSNSCVYRPSGNVIDVEIEQKLLNKDAAINAARDKMGMTFNVISSNNTQADQWNKNAALIIDSLLAARRKEITDLYS